VNNRKIVLLAGLLILTLSCQLSAPGQQHVEETPAAAAQGRVYESDTFRFTIPAGWGTYEEVWGRPMQADDDYYGLGVTTVVTIQHPPEKGQGNAFFSVATSRLAEGESLESRLNLAYANAVPEIEDESRQVFIRDELSGIEILYRRPWGEPWWKFRDIWLEKDAVVYVLSFHASPNGFDSFGDPFGRILESFTFSE
jgi:hypothetical protein